ncbi:hypothetical protein GCM10007291_49540 [Gemmobacter nanjingensis]|uniref:Uncharacterized protein n=1 Tax=Gemmobacter nanjingensis TaxID=488454 RepID=A0ABQ3FU37_9RHOB|nr:hypothetical protein [Gemmobacter nanjingensis]GHC41733.1 hypothetical protein GCM10007291_49540 [Gemmobacter nanjingensis]
MIITLSPIRSDASLTLTRQGDTLIINGVAYDFGPLAEGATLPREAVQCDWLASDVTRINGKIRLTLILPHGPIPLDAPPEARVVTHPEPVLVTTDGPILLPSYSPEEAAQ